MSWKKDNKGVWVWTADGKGNPNVPGDNVTPPPSFNMGSSSGSSTNSANSVYTVDVGFGLKDASGNPLSLPPIQIGSYITALAGTDPAAYNRVKNAVIRLTGRKKLDPNYVGGYVSKLAQNIMSSSDIIAKSGSLEDYFTKATAASGTAATPPQSYVSSPTQAKADIQKTFQDLLGRDATDKEIADLTTVLNDAQKKNPSRYVNGTTYGGLDKNQFLIDVITSGKYDAMPDISQKVLSGLAKEVATKKAEVQAAQLGKEEGGILAAKQAILSTAYNNGIKLSDSDVDNYLSQVKSGKNVDVVSQQIRDIAALGQPENVQKMIQAGTDLSAIYSPYRSRMSSVLEIPTSQINMDDPALRSAISANGPMTLYDYESTLRKDPRWQYTANARSTINSAMEKILKDFGFAG